jgi:hypothetical protein
MLVNEEAWLVEVAEAFFFGTRGTYEEGRARRSISYSGESG